MQHARQLCGLCSICLLRSGWLHYVFNTIWEEELRQLTCRRNPRRRPGGATWSEARTTKGEQRESDGLRGDMCAGCHLCSQRRQVELHDQTLWRQRPRCSACAVASFCEFTVSPARRQLHFSWLSIDGKCYAARLMLFQRDATRCWGLSLVKLACGCPRACFHVLA